MAWSRRGLLSASAVGIGVLAGCGGGGLSGAATPPPSSFEVTVADGAVELRYTGIGSQDPRKFRVVLEGAGAADGTYRLGELTDDTAWPADQRYVLDRSELGLSAPLSVENLTVTLQYDDDGDWRTLVRTDPAD